MSSDDFPQPPPNLRRINVVVVHPFFVSRIVGRINVDAFHLADVVRHERLERFEIVAFDEEILRVPDGQLRVPFQEPKRYVFVVVHDCLLADPIKGRHQTTMEGMLMLIMGVTEQGIQEGTPCMVIPSLQTVSRLSER